MLRNPLALALIALGLASVATPARADRPIAALQLFPAKIELHSARAKQSIVVQVRYEDGVTQDVTDQAELSLTQAALAKIEGRSLRPLADGDGELKARFGGREAVAPLVVRGAATERPISFKLDVMPVFMRSGCNSGSCHGAARGKDGFNLSLFGFDPDGDHHRLTRELGTRRINLALPGESLLLLKSTGAVPHTGGQCFKPDSVEYDAIRRWLEAGAPADAANIATPVALEVLPTQAVLEGEGATHRFTVLCRYSDGTTRDVTDLALYLTSNENSARISPAGVVTAGLRGEAFVMARFATFTVGAQVIVIPKGLKYEWPGVPEHNYIDTLVFNKLRKLRVEPSALCSDEVFLRRVFLDIAGVHPTVEEHARFLADTDPRKREKLVDDLLGRKEFVELWVMKFAELLQIRSGNAQQMSYKATLLYFNWLQDRLARNVPMNRIVQELLGATGGTFSSPATNYYQIERDTLKVAENVAQVFMGMRLQCAQCHNHPFDRWTMDDYYSFASFFSQVGRKPSSDPREQIVFNQGGGEVNHPLLKRPLPPRFLGAEAADVAGKDRRQVVAEWLASPRNPYFARNLSNIVWAHFFGRGIIDPVDDVRVSNPPSNPELLDELARRFTDYDYDFKKLVRDICTSRTYQLATQANPTNALDTTNFSKQTIRRVRAEVLLDVITQVTETKNKFKGLPLGARAVQVADGSVTSFFLTVFGRASRDTVCSCEVRMEPNLSQALHLLNGPTVHNKVRDGRVVDRLLEQGKTAEQVIEDLYVRTRARKPTQQEMYELLQLIPPKGDKAHAESLRHVFWALMNAKEFVFNH